MKYGFSQSQTSLSELSYLIDFVTLKVSGQMMSSMDPHVDSSSMMSHVYDYGVFLYLNS